jgi:hypothetical protein
MRLSRTQLVFSTVIVVLVSLVLNLIPVLASSFATWNSVSSGTKKDLKAIWGATGDDIFAAGSAGLLLHYNGTDWKTMKSGTTVNLNGIWGTGSGDIYAVGESGTILHYNGSAWSAIATDNQSDYYGIWGDGQNVYAVGEGGAIIRYDGDAWSSLPSSVTTDFYAIWGDNDEVFAVGQSGTISLYDGDNWTAMKSNTTQNLRGIWGIGDNNVFAVGDSSTIMHYNGRNWRSLSSDLTVDLNAIWGASADAVFVAGASGTVAYYDGNEFVSMNRDTTNDLYSVWGLSAIDIFAAGRSGTILRYLPPVITSISKNQADQGQRISITLHGQNLADVNAVRFGTGIAVNSFNVVDSTQISIDLTVVAGAATGARDVTVTTTGGSYTLPDSFSVIEALPVISTISPNHDKQGASLTVTITGTNLKGATEVGLGTGIAVKKFSLLSSNQIAVDISIAADARTGSRDISVITPAGSYTLPAAFSVQQAQPSIASINPTRGNQETSLTVTISGSDLNGAYDVDFGNGIIVNSFTQLSSSQIAADIRISASAETGLRDLSITTPGGGITLPNSFNVIQSLPVVNSISPDYGNKGATLNITLSGTGFSGASQVRLGSDIAINYFNVTNADQISASITILAGAATGPRNVTVTTPGGDSSLNNSFTVKQGLPVISSISPESGARGSTLDVIISGSNLDGTSVVSFGAGTVVESVSNLSATQLKVKLNIEASAVTGVRDVSVTTPGGSSTLGNNFSVKEKSLSVVVMVLIWVGVAVMVGVFIIVLNLLRKKRFAKINSG